MYNCNDRCFILYHIKHVHGHARVCGWAESRSRIIAAAPRGGPASRRPHNNNCYYCYYDFYDSYYYYHYY